VKGKLIVIEGTDCSGKETQSKLLVENLTSMGKKAICLSFPMYDTPTGKIVRGPYLGKPEICDGWFPEGSVEVDPKIASLYYAADRKYFLPTIEKYLQEDYYIILDRYTTSNLAHQGSKIKEKDERFNMYQWIDKLEYWLLKLPKPDMTVFLHVPYKFSIELSKNREEVDDAEKSSDHQKQAEEAYLELCELYNWDKIECVKEDKLRTIEDISEELYQIIENKD